MRTAFALAVLGGAMTFTLLAWWLTIAVSTTANHPALLLVPALILLWAAATSRRSPKTAMMTDRHRLIGHTSKKF